MAAFAIDLLISAALILAGICATFIGAEKSNIDGKSLFQSPGGQVLKLVPATAIGFGVFKAMMTFGLV